jgi:hypothetical protein
MASSVATASANRRALGSPSCFVKWPLLYLFGSRERLIS